MYNSKHLFSRAFRGYRVPVRQFSILSPLAMDTSVSDRSTGSRWTHECEEQPPYRVPRPRMMSENVSAGRGDLFQNHFSSQRFLHSTLKKCPSKEKSVIADAPCQDEDRHIPLWEPYSSASDQILKRWIQLKSGFRKRRIRHEVQVCTCLKNSHECAWIAVYSEKRLFSTTMVTSESPDWTKLSETL